MKATTMKVRSNSAIRLDTIRMSEDARRHASESLRQGEVFAAFVLHLAADARAVAQGVGHAAASLVRGIKAMLETPVKH